MLERIRPITALVEEMLDQLPKAVFTSKTTTFLDPCMGGGQFVAAIERRLRKHGHSDTNIAKRVYGVENNEFLHDYAVNTHDLVGNYRVEKNYLECEETMKFDVVSYDVVIGNPPYQDKEGNENSSNSKDLYTRFIQRGVELSKQYVLFVVPSAWTGSRNSKLKKLIFEDHQPIVLNTHGMKWFDVYMNTCYFLSEIDRSGETCLTDNYGNSITVTLDRTFSIPTDLGNLAIMKKLSAFAEQENLASRWIRGKLNLNRLVESKEKNSVEFIKAVGKKNDPLTTAKISKDDENTGYDICKVVLPNMGSQNSIGNVKLAKQKQVGGHSVVFLQTDSIKESKNLIGYLNSKVVRFLVSSIKISTPNSKAVFKGIPLINLSHTWTDEELYKHFKLTKKEIKYIENAVK